MDPTLVGLGAGAAGVTLIVILAVRALVRAVARRRVRQVEEPVLEPAVALSEPEQPVAVDEPADLDDEHSVLVRSLRAQVRTLEQALEQLPTDRIPALEPPQVPAEEEPAAAYRHQVALTLRALAGRTDHVESPQRTLARVAAAIERLDGSDQLVRPAIPAPVYRVHAPAELVESTSSVRTLAAPQPTMAFQAPVPYAVEQAVEDAFAGSFDDEEEVAGFANPEAVLFAADEPELVLPVPPPAAAEPKRNRRWLRRHAA